MADGPGSIVAHYGKVEEEGRFSSGVGELERVRTEKIMSRHLPPPPACILDVCEESRSTGCP